MPLAADELTLTFSHRILYTNKQPIPAEEIAEALLALSRIVHRTPQLLRAMVPGISQPKVELFVEHLESGSLIEDVIVRFGFGSKRKMNATIKRVKEALGVDLNSKSTAIRTLILVLLAAGALYAAKQYLTPAERATVEISHNTIINIGAAELNLPAEEIVKIIEAAIPNKTQLANDAVKVFKPAKRDPQAEVKFDGSDELKISHQTIALLPTEVTAEKKETTKVHEHAEIHLRANDLDSTEHGWAAVVVGGAGQRLPLTLAESINPDDLFGRKIVHGTVEEISRRDAYGKMQLRGYRLISLDPEK